jgi:DNA-binding response OmpR family regulator
MTSIKRVLWIDDDTLLLEMTIPQLAAKGFHIVAETSAASGLKRCTDDTFSAILLDIGLPDGNGCEVCGALREQGLNTPIIMLTGADGDADTICGLESGANDYIAKPFRLNLLVARLNAQIRQHEKHDDAVFMLGSYLFRPADKLLRSRQGKRIRLSGREVDILKYLCQAGRTVSREELLKEIWGYTIDVDTHTLESHIYRLRKKVEQDRDHLNILVTEPGGYRVAYRTEDS